MIVSYLPDHEKHPLWTEIRKLIALGVKDGIATVEPGEHVWIAFEGTTLFAAGTVILDGDAAQLLAVGGFEHKRWLNEALEVAASWARSAGAKRMVMVGRKGWARAFAGWNVTPGKPEWTYEKVL